MAFPIIRPNALPNKPGGLVDGDSVIVNNAGNLNRATYVAPVVPEFVQGFPPFTKIITVPIDEDLNPSPGWPVVFDSLGNFGPWLHNSFFGSNPAGICLSVDASALRCDVIVRGIVKLRTAFIHSALYETPEPRPFYIYAGSPWTFSADPIGSDGVASGHVQSNWQALRTRQIGVWLSGDLTANNQFSWAYVDFDKYAQWALEINEGSFSPNAWSSLPQAVGGSTYTPEYRNV